MSSSEVRDELGKILAQKNLVDQVQKFLLELD